MKVRDLDKYKGGLYSSLSKNLDAFEKNFILLSTGILAFSITFIKDIVKIDEASGLYILFLGWLFILIAIGLMMYAFLSSVDGHGKLWNIVDNYIIENKKFNSDQDLDDEDTGKIKEQINKANSQIKGSLRKMRNWSVSFFLIGVLLFSIFVCINLYRENHTNKSSRLRNANKAAVTIKPAKSGISRGDTLLIIYQ